MVPHIALYRIVDLTAHLVQQGLPAPLSCPDIQALVELAEEKEDGHVVDSGATWNESRKAVAVCLGLLSPSQKQQAHAMEALEVG
jgi:hypothetical protein